MKKTFLLFVMAFFAFSMQAQDRLVPYTKANSELDGYQADVNKYLSDGSHILCLILPSLWPEESLCWDKTTNELISTKAVSVIWDKRIYQGEKRRDSETQKPTLEKHRLRIPQETEDLIEGLLEDAVKNAMYPTVENGMTLDGTTFRFFSKNKTKRGSLAAEHYDGAGERVEELIRLTCLIMKAVEEESLEKLNTLIPDIKALRTKFREMYPDDIYEGTEKYSEVCYEDGRESQKPTLRAVDVEIVWTETTMKGANNEQKNRALKKAETRRKAFIQKYGAAYRAFLKRLFVSSEFSLTHCHMTIHVSTVPDAKPILVISEPNLFDLILPEKEVTPMYIERYMKDILSLQKFSMYRYNNGWQKQSDEEYNEYYDKTWKGGLPI